MFEHVEHLVICADVLDKNWYQAVGEWGIDLLTMSPPCPPWSSASTGQGLERDSGFLFLATIPLVRWFRPKYIALEQVGAFQLHPDKSFIVKMLAFMGYRFLFQRVVDLKDVMNTMRSRYLAVLVRASQWEEGMVQKLQWETVGKHVFSVPPVMTWDAETLKQLQITEEVYAVASDPRKTQPWNQHLPPNQVFAKRVHTTREVVPTFMAMYGMQHELPETFLNDRQYLGHFVQHSGQPHDSRFWHPAEVNVHHGTPQGFFILDDLHCAWQIAGNVISPAHAMIPLANILTWESQISTCSTHLFQALRKACMTDAKLRSVVIPGGSFFVPIDEVIFDDFLEHAGALLQMMHTQPHLIRSWSPTGGLVLYEDAIEIPASEPAVVSVVSTQLDATSTAPFEVIFKGLIHFLNQPRQFWFSMHVTASMLEKIWTHMYHADLDLTVPATHPVAHLKMRADQPAIQDDHDQVPLLILTEGNLTVYASDPSVAIRMHPAVADFQEAVFDQFGQVSMTALPQLPTVILDRPFEHDQPELDLVQLVAAFQAVTSYVFWEPNEGDFQLHIQGPVEHAQMVANFWSQVILKSSRETLGRDCKIESCSTKMVVHFSPLETGFPCPMIAFRMALSVLAARVILDSFSRVPGVTCDVPILLQWDGGFIWKGNIPTDTTSSILIMLLGFAFFPKMGGLLPWMVHRGTNLTPEVLINTLAINQTKRMILLHAIHPVHGGGGHSKNQQRALQQSALASVLLDQGYDLSWVNKTADSLINKYGLQRLQATTSQPMGATKVKAVLQLVRDADLEVPQQPPLAAQKLPSGPTWNKMRKSTKPQVINPADFTLVKGFFLREDGSDCAQIEQFKVQATGIYLATPAEALPWIQAAQTISCDELGLVVCGQLPMECSMDHARITFPCQNLDQNTVLIAGCLIQMGSRKITIKKSEIQAPADECDLCAITLYREDWDPQWPDIVSSPAAFIRSQAQQDQLEDAIVAIWGRALRNQRSQATPANATTLQMHASILHTRMEKFLAKSGYNQVCATPKTKDGRVATDYRVVWAGEDAHQLTMQSSMMPQSLGLVRGKNTYGVRVRAADFSKVWATLHPGQDEPKPVAGDKMYKLEGLPFGVTSQALGEWAKAAKWSCQPIKALGPQSWLVRAEQAPANDMLWYNSTPILVRFLPPKIHKNEPVVVGPRSLKSSGPDPFQMPQNDPWKQYRGIAGTKPVVTSSAPSGTLPGPVESRLQAQDERLASMQEDIKKLTASQDVFVKETTKKFHTVEQQQQQQATNITQAMDDLKKDISQSLQHTVRQNSQMLDTRLNELKALLQSNKRPADEDTRMES